ncbi:divalent cation tolerance protein CutA [Amycolatopsis pittospori]|uniref:divalent cation tolerance protein CutA n=1 Tax=Amycolatopsis pittospori TaxID=2749434 RepID=UPI0015F0D7D0|nr:divalent cation tolerance protein CutA [Amycolatopsis pittospori]
MTGHLVVTTATPHRESGERLAGSAVAARLAETPQVVGPVTSFFWHIVENHPWNNPEVTAVELVRGSAEYLAWLEESTRPN